jgi:ATP-dependent protease HslVU (ClpYQ) peptidase subunit
MRKRPAAVVAADKMVTFGAPMSLQAEPPTLNKIIQRTEKVLLVLLGSKSDGKGIVTGALPCLLSDPNQSVL